MGKIVLRSRWAEVIKARGDGDCDACARVVKEGEPILTDLDGGVELWICVDCVAAAYDLMSKTQRGPVNKRPPEAVDDDED